MTTSPPISLVSKDDGSIIGTKTSLSPSPWSHLTKAIESLLLDVQDVALKVYIFSISPALNADRTFEFHKAMEALETSSPFIDPTIFHGETYIISFLQAKENNGERQADIIHEERILILATVRSTALFSKVFKKVLFDQGANRAHHYQQSCIPSRVQKRNPNCNRRRVYWRTRRRNDAREHWWSSRVNFIR